MPQRVDRKACKVRYVIYAHEHVSAYVNRKRIVELLLCEALFHGTTLQNCTISPYRYVEGLFCKFVS